VSSQDEALFERYLVCAFEYLLGYSTPLDAASLDLEFYWRRARWENNAMQYKYKHEWVAGRPPKRKK
jgi:hypothetical protein